jgi:hypothetical protein
MYSIALKMLFHDRAKYLGLVLGVAFSTLLINQQLGIFIGLITRAGAVIVDVPQADVWVMDPGVKLQYVRTEPLVVPKRNLTGTVSERVDTRVMQVIYAISPASLRAIVGQQVDVYIEDKSLHN